MAILFSIVTVLVIGFLINRLIAHTEFRLKNKKENTDEKVSVSSNVPKP
jgi:hypothetical protein